MAYWRRGQCFMQMRMRDLAAMSVRNRQFLGDYADYNSNHISGGTRGPDVRNS
jgi:hypothetical protein